jgi:hypothetical protein
MQRMRFAEREGGVRRRVMKRIHSHRTNAAAPLDRHAWPTDAPRPPLSVTGGRNHDVRTPKRRSVSSALASTDVPGYAHGDCCG